MEKPMSVSFGVALLILTIAGFVLDTKHLLRLMNIDDNHSIIRVPLTAALLHAGTDANLKTTRKILLGTGLLYVAIGSAGLIDKKLGGLLPSKLTKFDIAYHFAAGTAAIWMGSRSSRMLKP
ncbi:MAG TPA: hypothetical protein VF575_03830 [Candidatus Saccharimonadales bacterium]|jgi:hypothetical protein